jgi:nucleotide-binding universal stress UspA family protein
MGTQPQDGLAGLDPAALFGNVLCAVDGKPGGFVAVEQAAALAGPHGHLTLLVVTSFRSEGEYRSPAIGPAEATRILERATQIAHEAGVASTVEADPATPPAQVILDWSARHDLLALGAPATSWLGGMFIASVGDTALGAFTTPLLVTRATPAEGRVADRILVASDGREGSDELVELGRRLARSRNADVMLMHATGYESHARRHRVEEQGRRLEIASPGMSEVRVERGHAHDVIVGMAESVGASLVVMGSRRLDGMRAIGSVSRRVVHEAHCSVLILSPEYLQS